LASVGEPDPVSDLGFMTKNGKQFTVIKNANEGLPSFTSVPRRLFIPALQ
jgi:hypothetical protein